MWTIDDEKEQKIKDLHSKLQSIMLRRLKKDVVQSLPTKSERILRVEMSEMQMYWYKAILTKVWPPTLLSATEADSDVISPFDVRIMHCLLRPIPKSRC